VFSGIVQTVGVLAGRQPQGQGARLVVRGELPGGPVVLGESVAVAGACLTVEEASEGLLTFFCSRETLQRTTLGQLPLGTHVNLERALQVGDRLGGHWVSGHVDARVRVLGRRVRGEEVVVRLELPEALAPEVAEKGSVAVDGVSLTVAAAGPGWFEVSLVPFTLRATTLGHLRVGSVVNLETDLLSKYVRRALAAAGKGARGSGA